MNKKRKVIISSVIVAILGALLISLFYPVPFEGEHTKYKCDVKNFRFATTIKILKENNNYAEIRGNIFTFVTDPLTMYDLEDNKIGYAGDAYNFLAQDSHSIYVGEQSTVEMVGQIDLFGESYKIYDMNKKLIASVSFNMLDTRGKMKDINGHVIADYTSNVFANDFKVRVGKDCPLNEDAVLMIFASYYSDKSYDSSNE